MEADQNAMPLERILADQQAWGYAKYPAPTHLPPETDPRTTEVILASSPPYQPIRSLEHAS